MRLIIKLSLCLLLLPASLFCQERMRQVMIGPGGDGSDFRIAIAFIEPSEETFKMQSLIISTNRVKNKNEQPTSFLVDLTSTVRNVSSGTKKQKIFVFRWDKSTQLETKCEGGKWTKQPSTTAELDKIIETVKAVTQNVPLDTKQPVETTLSPEVEQKVISVLENFGNWNLPCLRDGQ